jgi:predicted MFS family arabinose efflux permease
MKSVNVMPALERKAAISLASIYGLRMLGMFLLLPIFAIYAESLQGGKDHTLIGLAMGAYGIMQVLLQLPFGIASDKFGRKPVIYFGLILFIIGSIVAAMAGDIVTMIIGRSIQGAGAISAVVTALVADLTSIEHRTKAMAMIGATIGITFAISLVLGPLLSTWIGVSGIFWMTSILCVLAALVVKFIVPNPQRMEVKSTVKMRDILTNTQLLRLNFGSFALHAAQIAMFLVVPFALQNAGHMPQNQHWKVYLPVLLLSFALMVPAIIVGEKRGLLKEVMIGAVALMLVAQLLLMNFITSFWGVVFSLLVYFVAFNILEASLPSLVSKIAPPAAKGMAMGVHNTAQSLGMAMGAVSAGFISQHYGQSDVFLFCACLIALWLMFAVTMQAPQSNIQKQVTE